MLSTAEDGRSTMSRACQPLTQVDVASVLAGVLSGHDDAVVSAPS